MMNLINSLPDEILTHILSFQRTKEAMQTCLVSKKWRHSWAFLPVLKFDIKDWVDLSINDDEIHIEGEDKFENFLNGVLDNRKLAHLDFFEYKNVIAGCESEISLEFLDRVAQLNPREVCIDISRVNQMELPDGIFSCASLEKLHLSIFSEDATIIRPKEVHLVSLKSLELMGVMVSDEDGFLKKLSKGCPVLEDLCLENCHLDISEISSDVLKQLFIYECAQSRRTRISCPNLACLVIHSTDEVPGYELTNMVSLQYADICLTLEDNHGDLNLFCCLSNVSELSLGLWSNEFKEKLEKDISECNTFNNLLHLDIDYWRVSYDKELLACFLKHSPRLQELSLNIGDSENNEVASPDDLRNVAFKREYLKTVRIATDGNSDVNVNRLINILHSHINTIEKILIR